MAITETGREVREIVDEYIRRLKKHRVPVWRVYLYGSHAKGNPRHDSDIDLAVFLEQEDIYGFPEDIELMRLRWEIDLRIEPHAFARSDFDETDPYIKEIIDTGIRIV